MYDCVTTLVEPAGVLEKERERKESGNGGGRNGQVYIRCSKNDSRKTASSEGDLRPRCLVTNQGLDGSFAPMSIELYL